MDTQVICWNAVRLYSVGPVEEDVSEIMDRFQPFSVSFVLVSKEMFVQILLNYSKNSDLYRLHKDYMDKQTGPIVWEVREIMDRFKPFSIGFVHGSKEAYVPNFIKLS